MPLKRPKPQGRRWSLRKHILKLPRKSSHTFQILGHMKKVREIMEIKYKRKYKRYKVLKLEKYYIYSPIIYSPGAVEYTDCTSADE